MNKRWRGAIKFRRTTIIQSCILAMSGQESFVERKATTKLHKTHSHTQPSDVLNYYHVPKNKKYLILYTNHWSGSCSIIFALVSCVLFARAVQDHMLQKSISESHQKLQTRLRSSFVHDISKFETSHIQEIVRSHATCKISTNSSGVVGKDDLA